MKSESSVSGTLRKERLRPFSRVAEDLGLRGFYLLALAGGAARFLSTSLKPLSTPVPERLRKGLLSPGTISLAAVNRCLPLSLGTGLLIGLFFGLWYFIGQGAEFSRFFGFFAQSTGPLVAMLILAVRVIPDEVSHLREKMKNEEIRALETMGLPARALLVRPRLLAMVPAGMTLALWTTIAMTCGFAACLSFGERGNLAGMSDFITRTGLSGALFLSAVKGALFGFIAGWLLTYEGLEKIPCDRPEDIRSVSWTIGSVLTLSLLIEWLAQSP